MKVVLRKGDVLVKKDAARDINLYIKRIQGENILFGGVDRDQQVLHAFPKHRVIEMLKSGELLPTNINFQNLVSTFKEGLSMVRQDDSAVLVVVEVKPELNLCTVFNRTEGWKEGLGLTETLADIIDNRIALTG